MVNVVAGYSSGAGIRFNLDEFDNLRVPAGIVVNSTDSTAVVATGSNQTVVVIGYVSALATIRDAILMGDEATDRGHRVENAGVIQAYDTGIGITGFDSDVVNSGLITGRYGIQFINGTSATTASLVQNSGTIAGELIGIYHVNVENLTIINNGLISGQNAAITSNSSRLTLINNGRIIGDVNLGDGNDIYDGRSGTLVGGEIAGEGGNDLFRPGRGIETIDGGLGADTLDFRFGAGTRVSLAGAAQNSATAFADTYVGIENILGSRTGNDVLFGDSGNNGLRSYGGADKQAGGGGNDTLGGGTGRDTLIGGAGDDRFEFLALAEGGDVIMDFGSGAGNDDAIVLRAAAFGGLAVGALAAVRFQVRVDNHAQDANDRFIFRTTDRTLWFDANGNAAGGLSLVADLQAGAVLTAADILLI